MRNKLREIRVIKRVTQEELERKSGISQSRISLIENSYFEADDEQKKRLASALRVRVGDVWKRPLVFRKNTILTLQG